MYFLRFIGMKAHKPMGLLNSVQHIGFADKQSNQIEKNEL